MNLKLSQTDIADIISTALVPLLDNLIEMSKTRTLEELQAYLKTLRDITSTPSTVLSAIEEGRKEAKEELENKPQ